MGKTTILEESEDIFEEGTGLIHKRSQKVIKHAKPEETDEFIKVSRYINTIFAYQGIPLSLVPISLIFAQRMEFKTNKIYLLKSDKEEIAEMLGCSLKRVESFILECKKYDIIRVRDRGVYEVNSFLYSTGNLAETRDLQAHMDFEANTLSTQGVSTNLITGDRVRKSVTDAKIRRRRLQIPGQMSLEDFGDDNE
jgi:hypothetical protein